MSYFAGARAYGPFEMKEGKTSINYVIIEQWINTGGSKTVRCKASTEMVHTLTVGISRAELDSFKSSVSGSLGKKDLASLGSNIESQAQITTTFSASRTTTNTFTCPAPGCGRTTYTLYQLARDYRFVITKPGKLFGTKTFPHNFRELTNDYDLREETDPDEPQCPCPKTDDEDKGEIVSLKIGRFSLRVDAKRNQDGKASFKVGNQTYAVDLSEGDAPLEIEIKQWPTMFHALSGIRKGPVKATVSLEKQFEPDDLRIREHEIAGS